MKSIAFFNNKGGVGKTSLIYHLASMYAELGLRVLAADLDPQSNLTAMFLEDDMIESLYGQSQLHDALNAVEPPTRSIDALYLAEPLAVTDRLWLIPGNLLLSDFEGDLADAWSSCLDRSEQAFRVISAFYRVIDDAGQRCRGDIAFIDVGPNFGALTRAAMIAADYVVIPVAPDLFSVLGLRNVGKQLKSWRREWEDRLGRAPKLEFDLPPGTMKPIGFVISRQPKNAYGAASAFQTWIARIPIAYRDSVEASPLPDIALSLGQIKDYRSLIAIAQEAHKPMFKLKPGDGAIGGHQGAVTDAYQDFERLARRIAKQIDLTIPAP